MFYTPTRIQDIDSEDMLLYQHAYLWSDPGTGKTLTAMEAYRKIGGEKLVVICPTIALGMWVEELKKHLGMGLVVRLDSGRGSKKIPYYKADAIVTTPDLAGKHKKLLTSYAAGKESANDTRRRDKPNSVLIIDEAHMFKTPTAKRTTAVLGNGCSGFDGVAGAFESIWQLTGTPIMRHADDLWSQLVIGRRNVLKAFGVETYDKFVNEFCVVKLRKFSPHGQPKRVVTGSRNTRRLNELITACGVIRRRLEDVVDMMPEITYRTVEVNYADVPPMNVRDMKEFMEALNNEDSQISKVRRLLGLGKLQSSLAYIEEYAARPALIGFWHTDVGEAAAEELGKKHRVAIISGKTPGKQRDQIIKDFNSGKLDFVLGQVKALGVSANMQERCNYVVMLEEVVSPGELEQFVARVHRRGQRHHVQVDMLRSQHDIDAALVRVRNSKWATIEKVIN